MQLAKRRASSLVSAPVLGVDHAACDTSRVGAVSARTFSKSIMQLPTGRQSVRVDAHRFEVDHAGTWGGAEPALCPPCRAGLIALGAVSWVRAARAEAGGLAWLWMKEMVVHNQLPARFGVRQAR